MARVRSATRDAPRTGPHTDQELADWAVVDPELNNYTRLDESNDCAGLTCSRDAVAPASPTNLEFLRYQDPLLRRRRHCRRCIHSQNNVHGKPSKDEGRRSRLKPSPRAEPGSHPILEYAVYQYTCTRGIWQMIEAPSPTRDLGIDPSLSGRQATSDEWKQNNRPS